MPNEGSVALTESSLPHRVAPRILFYAVNGLGLGHVTRLLAIARCVRALRPEAQILFLTTSDADWVIYRAGFAAVKIPSRSILPTAKLRPSVYTKLVQTVVMNTVAAFNPAILVADTFPAGASQELLPTLSWEMRRAFVFRAQKQERATDAFFQHALAAYDICIAPHLEGEEEIPIPAGVKLIWAGPIMIRSADEVVERAVAREKLDLPRTGRIVYICFGGGGDIEAAHAAALAIEAARRSGWIAAVADAPLSATGRVEASESLFPVNYYPMAELLSAYDAAISAAGYNSVAELMHFGVPSVLIPFERGLDDQFARVRRLVSAGAALTCDLTVDAMAQALSQLDDASHAERLATAAKSAVAVNGAAIAATAILELL